MGKEQIKFDNEGVKQTLIKDAIIIASNKVTFTDDDVLKIAKKLYKFVKGIKI